MKTWELIKDFQLKCPEIVKDLVGNTHHFSESILNPHHLEGNTWAHTCQVLLMAEHLGMPLNVRIAALLHDVAKPYCTTRSEEDKKIRMHGHEGASIFLCLSYLNSLGLPEVDKVQICKMISYHTYLYQSLKLNDAELKFRNFFANEKKLFQDLVLLTRADSLGRFADSEDRKFWMDSDSVFSPIIAKVKETPKRATEGEVILLVGPPMSGKSTWARNKGLKILSQDDIMMEEHQEMTYNEAYKVRDRDLIMNKFSERKKEFIASGESFIIDKVCMSPKSRRRLLADLPKKMKKRAVVFLVPFEELNKWNEKRAKEEDKYLRDDHLKLMLCSYSMPLYSEGFDEIEYVF